MVEGKQGQNVHLIEYMYEQHSKNIKAESTVESRGREMRQTID